MAPKRINREEILARLCVGTTDRIRAVLGDGETVAGFMRQAIEEEISQREASGAQHDVRKEISR